MNIIQVFYLQALGKVGKVLKVYVDGDLRVAVGGTTWTFNPAVCTLMPHTQQEMNNTLGSQHNRDDHHTSKACHFLHHFISLSLLILSFFEVCGNLWRPAGDLNASVLL